MTRLLPLLLLLAPTLAAAQGAAPDAEAPVHGPEPASFTPDDDGLFMSVYQPGGKVVRVNFEAGRHGLVIDADVPGAVEPRFAYQVDRTWTGPHGTERVVHIIATPGVLVDTYAWPSASSSSDPEHERRPVPDVVYVQNPLLVPTQGQPVEPSRLLAMAGFLGTNPGVPESALLVTHGRAGVTIREVLRGSVVRIHGPGNDPTARFAYYVAKPESGGQMTEIRVLAGPGITVERYEPAPQTIGMPTVDSLADMNVRLVLYRTPYIERIPPQGATLELPLMRAVGKPRAPDVNHARVTPELDVQALDIRESRRA